MTVGIVIAVEQEFDAFIRDKKYKKQHIGTKEYYLFKVGKEKCVAVLSGIGKVNAAHAATLMIRDFDPDLLINAGISGGLGVSTLLDVIVADKVVQHDVDTTALGDPIGFVSTVKKVYFNCDMEIAGKACKLLNGKMGVVACGDRFVADVNGRDFIIKNFNAIACDMESAAIAQIAYIENVKFVCLRCISDGADGEAAKDYNKLMEMATKKLASVLTTLLGSL